MIEVFDHAFVLTNKHKKHGLLRGDVVMVAGTIEAPVKKSDPYTKRTYFKCIKVKDGIHQIPTETNGLFAYLLDPKTLQKVSGEIESELRESIKHRYSNGNN